MKKATLPFAAILLLGLGCATTDESTEQQAQIDRRVRQLLARMTLEEKVGQMTQITLESFIPSDAGDSLILDPQKLREGIVSHHIGSVFNCGGQARSVQRWQTIITQIQDIATKETRLGIPILYGIDSVHGANYLLGGTLFPQNIAMAATGNVELMERVGEITATETRAMGIPWNFSPVLGLGRQPMWPRFFETFGEDAYIASVMGAAYIEGLQGNDLSRSDKVAACMKHYAGYSWPYSGNDRTPAYIPERQMRGLFLKPFAAAVRAGAATCMVNSSEINGIPVHTDRYLLDDVLRGELGFEGLIVSDWADIENLYTREKVAADRREAVKMAVMAGIDMSMVPYDYSFAETLIELVHDGEVPVRRINEAVARILQLKFRLGLFDSPYPRESRIAAVGTDEAQAANLQAAREAITLLKNDRNVLPLRTDWRILVTGPCADELSVLNGGWTLTWDGSREELYPQDKLSIVEAVREKIGLANTLFVGGVTFDEELDIPHAVASARVADAVVACVGEPPYCETPGNIDDLTMSEPQLKLIRELATTGKPIVLVLVQGRPRVIHSIVDEVPGIIMAYLPGVEGGRAIADVLFGDVNPSGKLPFTYPRFPGGFKWYDHKPSEATSPNKFDPQWEFGHGLSYAPVTYRALRTDQSVLSPGRKMAVMVDVTNTGNRPGKEIVQLFVTDEVASITPPVKVLKRFKKIDLLAKQTDTVRFELTWDDLTFIGRDNRPVVEPGRFRVGIGDLSVSFEAREEAK